MRYFLLLLFFISVSLVPATGQSQQSNGLVTKPSAYTFTESVSKLKSALQDMGITLVAEVDHATAAANKGLQLRPTHVLIFGNPLVGTQLMQADQRTGLELPLKLLVWEDEKGQVYLSYRQPHDLQQDFTLNEQKAVLEKMGKVFERLSEAVRK